MFATASNVVLRRGLTRPSHPTDGRAVMVNSVSFVCNHRLALTEYLSTVDGGTELNLNGFKKVFGFTAFVIVSLTCISLYSTQHGRDGALGSISEGVDAKGADKLGNGVARLPFMGYNSTCYNYLFWFNNLGYTRLIIFACAFTYIQRGTRTT